MIARLHTLLSAPAARYRLYALLGLLTAIFLAIKGMGDTDYRVYWTAGQRWLAAADLYPSTDGHFSFKYFPTFALLQAPLGWLPYELAVALWIGLVLWATLWLYETSAHLAGMLGRVSLGLVLLTFLILVKHTGRELILGQANIVMVLLLLRGVVAQLDNKPRQAGLWSALAVAVKPYAVLLWLYWLLRGQWRAAATGVLGFGLILLLTMLRWPLAEWDDVWRGFVMITGGSTESLDVSLDNASLLGACTQWLGGSLSPGAVKLVALGLLALLAALFLPGLRGPYTAEKAVREVAALTVFLVLAAPQGWYYLICGAPLAVLVVLQQWSRFPLPARGLLVLALLTIGATFYDVFMPLGGKPAYEAFLASGAQTLAYAALIVALAWLRDPQPAVQENR